MDAANDPHCILVGVTLRDASVKLSTWLPRDIPRYHAALPGSFGCQTTVLWRSEASMASKHAVMDFDLSVVLQALAILLLSRLTILEFGCLERWTQNRGSSTTNIFAT